MKFAIETLGCFKNTVDSELIITELGARYQYTDNFTDAELIIINTCCFVDKATQESIENILIHAREEKKIVVVGCLGQRYGREILDKIPEVDGIGGVYAYANIKALVEKVVSGERTMHVQDNPVPGSVCHEHRHLLTPSHYAFVKISDGCNRKCGFCIIPRVKGKLRSRSMESIVAEVRGLARRGVKEINLISQDTTSYGMDRYGKKSLVELLEKLVAIDGIIWIRLLYNYPGEVDRALLDVICDNARVCKYLDIPIQHISDSILLRMKREISGKKIRRFLDLIKERYPAIRLRTTLLVGFPGERDGEFEELCGFVREMEFDRLGVFPYSREYGTGSYDLEDTVSDAVKEERVRVIMEMQGAINLKKNQSLIGTTIPVMVDEQVGNKLLDGRTEFDAPEIDNGVLVNGDQRLVGQIIPVRIVDGFEYDLIGHVEQERGGA